MRVKITPLDKLVSEYIRRLSGGYCERCLQYKGWENLQACHIISRRYKQVRYDPDNIMALDFGCHQYLDSHPQEKIDFAINKLGQEGYDLLLARSRVIGKIDYNGLILYYKNKLALLQYCEE